jgi:hypothetical protein
MIRACTRAILCLLGLTTVLPAQRRAVWEVYAVRYGTLQGVRVAALIASDNMYLYENLERHVPIAQTLDPASNLAAHQRMTTIASETRLIVPGHDPAVFTRFPLVAPGVVRIR